MKKMLLITRGFPYGTSEQSFLQTEFRTLAEAFDITAFSEGTDPLPVQKGFENVKTIRYEDKTLKELTGKAVLRKDTLRDMADAVRGASPEMAYRRVREITGYSARACFMEPALREAIMEVEPDIIYSFWCTPATLAALRLKKEFPEIKVISRFHGYDLYNERRPSMRQPFKPMISKELDAVFFVSRCGKEYFEKTWNRRGSVHYLGTVKRKTVDENPERLILASCSNMIELKRIDLIIEALAKLPEDIKVSWYHYGDGPAREALEKQARDVLAKRENVEYCFAGFVDNDALIKAYREIKPWLFISTSATEGGVPVSMQEAFSMGIPCIGTDVGGIPEIIQDGYNGLLLEASPETEDISAAIERYYRLPGEQREKFRMHAHETWERSFDAEVNAKKFLQELTDKF